MGCRGTEVLADGACMGCDDCCVTQIALPSNDGRSTVHFALPEWKIDLIRWWYRLQGWVEA